MTERNVYFVQVGFSFGKSLYLPYAAGTLAAYAFADAKTASSYRLGGIFFRRDRISEIISRLENPAVVAFSCYVWNYEFNKALAKEVKRAFPSCTVVFGGHNIDSEKPDDYLDFVDIFIFGEGEIPFNELLKALPSGDFSRVPSIAYRKDGAFVRNDIMIPPALDNLPSPYLSGVFDGIIRENPDVDFLAVLETNRGCPYSCAYCDWCSGRKVRLFPEKKVLDEIRWLSDNKIEYCFCADSNFGMFDRDMLFTEQLVSLKGKTGFPKVFRPCYAKNNDDNVFAICSLLNRNGMDKGATMAYQTLSDDALANINRKNLTLGHFSELMGRYAGNHITTYSELILALPGETYESFCSGLCALLDAGQHNSISVYYCELLPNSPMSRSDYIARHGIVSERTKFNHIHSSSVEEEVGELSDIVVATNTMSREMWVRSNMFSICLQCFHNLGLLRCFAIYLRNEKDITYLDFYNRLLEFILASEGTLMNGLFSAFFTCLSTPGEEWNYRNERLGEAAWFFEEGAFIEAIENYDSFFEEMTPFLRSFGIEDDVFSSLLSYQKEIIRRPGFSSADIVSDMNFVEYFEGIYTGSRVPLQKKHSAVRYEFNDGVNDIATYARELVWYGRRKGAAFASNYPCKIINE